MNSAKMLFDMTKGEHDGEFQLKVDSQINLGGKFDSTHLALSRLLMQVRVTQLTILHMEFKNHGKAGKSFKEYLEAFDGLALSQFDKELLKNEN